MATRSRLGLVPELWNVRDDMSRVGSRALLMEAPTKRERGGGTACEPP